MLDRRAGNSPHDDLLPLRSNQLVEFGHTRFARDHHHVRLTHRHRQVTKLGQIKLDRGIIEELLENDRAGNIPDDGCVFGRRVERVIGGDNAPGSCHIIDNDRRITRDIF